ncbi:hypothetical protein ACT8ZV_09150 [Nocardioides sp. MAHUQ-72]|uniref:hypothetical protein n=1 Tax=unclassified Nocardioides TaxID=2615069 RepID=UPI00361C7373
MFWWIVVAVVVVGLAAYAFWPRRGGISDRRARSDVQTFQGKVENYNNPSGPNFGGPL